GSLVVKEEKSVSSDGIMLGINDDLESNILFDAVAKDGDISSKLVLPIEEEEEEEAIDVDKDSGSVGLTETVVGTGVDGEIVDNVSSVSTFGDADANVLISQCFPSKPARQSHT